MEGFGPPLFRKENHMKNKLLLTLSFVILISSPALADVNATGAAAALSEISIGPSTTVIPKETLQAPITNAQYLQQIAGAPGEASAEMMKFDGMRACSELYNPRLIKILYKKGGNWFWNRVKWEDANEIVLEGINQFQNFHSSEPNVTACWNMYYKPSSEANATSGTASVAGSGGGGSPLTMMAGLLPSFGRSTSDREHFFEIDMVRYSTPPEVAHITPPAPAPVAAQVPTPPPVTIINNIPAVPVPVPQPEAKKVVKKWRQDKGHCVKWEK